MRISLQTGSCSSADALSFCIYKRAMYDRAHNQQILQPSTQYKEQRTLEKKARREGALQRLQLPQEARQSRAYERRQ